MEKKIIELKEMSSLTVEELVKILAKSYISLIKNGKQLSLFPSVMLWGQPGVGKSQGVRQIASEIEKYTTKKVNITDVRLMLFNPIDLRGIPTFNQDHTLAVWLKPKIFEMDESDDVINILFLDEISSAPQSVQAAAYQITLDKKIGEHVLPKNCIVIAAGNRISDRSVTYKMPKALANRLLHFSIVTDFQSWKKWALKVEINPKIISFLAFREDLLNSFDSSNDELSFATPRSWEMVSNILNFIDDDLSLTYPLIAGLIGKGVASEFLSYEKLYSKLPRIEDIISGKNVPIPTEPSLIYALCTLIVSYARNHTDDFMALGNAVNFARHFPIDFASMLANDLLIVFFDKKEELLKIPNITSLISRSSILLNGD